MSYRVVTSRVCGGEIESHENTVSTVNADAVREAVCDGYHVSVWQGKKLLQYHESHNPRQPA